MHLKYQKKSLCFYHFQLKDIQNPPNINCVDSQGNSCLHCAAYRGHKKTAVLLLQNGIDTNIRNNMGKLNYICASFEMK